MPADPTEHAYQGEGRGATDGPAETAVLSELMSAVEDEAISVGLREPSDMPESPEDFHVFDKIAAGRV